MRACLLGFAMLASVTVIAQAPAGASFEVASVKRHTSGARFGIDFTPGRFTAINATVERLIHTAYGLPEFRLVDRPGWITEERFDVLAKAPDSTAPPTRAEILVMLRGLLADRFALSTHTETRELPVYSLVLARDDGTIGRALQRSTMSEADCVAYFARRATSPTPVDGPRCGVGGRASVGRERAMFVMTLRSMTMTEIANSLAVHASRPVVDETGLEGRFDLEIEFMPDFMNVSLPPSSTERQTSPALLTALPEQAGLRLESRRAPVEVLVVDHVERPTPD